MTRIAEGDLVAAHSHYVTTSARRDRAVIDLFRVRDGQIVEQPGRRAGRAGYAVDNNTMF